MTDFSKQIDEIADKHSRGFIFAHAKAQREIAEVIKAAMCEAIKLALTMEPSAGMLDAAIAGGAYSKIRSLFVYRDMVKARLKELGML